jgi:hypothetical protein
MDSEKPFSCFQLFVNRPEISARGFLRYYFSLPLSISMALSSWGSLPLVSFSGGGSTLTSGSMPVPLMERPPGV